MEATTDPDINSAMWLLGELLLSVACVPAIGVVGFGGSVRVILVEGHCTLVLTIGRLVTEVVTLVTDCVPASIGVAVFIEGIGPVAPT